jgi:FkbM family methyltransferase
MTKSNSNILADKKRANKSYTFHDFPERLKHKLVYVSCSKLDLEYIQGHLIAPALVSKDSIVLDLGGNLGSFSKAMAERFGTVCYCIEPNPDLFEKIDPTELIHKANIAISDKDGKMELTLSQNAEASSFFPGIVEKWGIKHAVVVDTMTLMSFCKSNKIEEIDLLKVDIEGSELSLLSTMTDKTLQSIPQLTIEFHEFLDDVLIEPTNKAIKRMEALGFMTIVYSREKYADVLFLNKKHFILNAKRKFWYWLHRQVAYKYKGT